MAPREPRADSYARAARAAAMRGAGATFQAIADREGYKNRRAAALAVQRHYERENSSPLVNRRHDADEGYRIVQQMLFTELADAKQRGDHQTTVTTARAITDTIDKRVRLLGLTVPVAQQVDVHVQQSVTAVIDRATDELLALLPTQPHAEVLEALAVIDAEVVE